MFSAVPGIGLTGWPRLALSICESQQLDSSNSWRYNLQSSITGLIFNSVLYSLSKIKELNSNINIQIKNKKKKEICK